MRFLLILITALAGVSPVLTEPVATIRLYNPTEITGPALVEVPVGRIATPGLIDWRNHKLIVGDVDVPYAVREGRAHWEARLTAPAEPPRAEDLLVFSYPVPPGEWVEVDVVPGTPDRSSALTEENGQLFVRYPDVEATIDGTTGMLTSLVLFGEPAFDGPMTLSAFTLPEDAFEYTGNIGPGYIPFKVDVARGDTVPVSAHLVSSSSTPAMTELNFALSTASGPAMALTYRIHSSALVEIILDERPWDGPSPWMHYGVSCALPLRGAPSSLPLLENRQPFYGFKDFAGTVHQVANKHAGETVGVVELGEETPNGRHWLRRIQARPVNEGSPSEWLELMDEGLVVDLVPVGTNIGPTPRRIFTTAQTAPMVDILAEALEDAGFAATLTDDPSGGGTVRFELLPDNSESTIVGDGYEIQLGNKETVQVVAKTLLGLHQATSDMAAGLRHDRHLPLIARNPVVDMRGGGFGGGAFEVDFPYGDDTEWERVFDNLLASGMNTFWCLGMWGNWKLPVSYAAMPELRSDDPKAYDESSGVLFTEYEQHRDHGLKLMKYLQERGGRVYVWLPIGCVPTTFTEQFPEALKPGTVEEFWGRPKGTPCFTHPIYQRYLDVFLRELIETYPLDGVVLVRDDNGGVCDCERCTAFVEQSRTRNAVWEQYLQIYEHLRTLNFQGAIGVYPYFDGYTPALDAVMPDDLFIAGHGASTAILTRNQEYIGHMPDTWLDNLYTNFKLPSSPRMRRLLGDRGSFYIGGAYNGTELPWEALGYFGWEPTASVNTFRYDWGMREFRNAEAAIAFVKMNDTYEALWDINARFMIPNAWIKLIATERERITNETSVLLETYAKRLAALRQAVSGGKGRETWFDQMALFVPFFDYHLHRLNLFMDMQEIARTHSAAIDAGNGMPSEARAALVAKWEEMQTWAEKYSTALEAVPGNMLKATRNLTKPYNEWMAGYEGWLEPQLDRRQFAAKVSLEPPVMEAGKPFELCLNVLNTGFIPWDTFRVEFSESATALNLEAKPEAAKHWIAPGDHAAPLIIGTAPATPGEAEITFTVYSATRGHSKMGDVTVKIAWE